MVPMHMGALHPYEQVLTLVLAFGPFLLLGAVIWHRRRQDEQDPTSDRPAPGSRSADR